MIAAECQSTMIEGVYLINPIILSDISCILKSYAYIMIYMSCGFAIEFISVATLWTRRGRACVSNYLARHDNVKAFVHEGMFRAGENM